MNSFLINFVFRDGAAFYIDKDLNKGHTYKSETYYNNPFVNEKENDSSFQVVALELYALIWNYLKYQYIFFYFKLFKNLLIA